MKEKRTAAPKEYRFLIPQTHTMPLGTQGEMATSIPYRLEPGITPESILRELRAQPHMEGVAESLEEGRRTYLLYGSNLEQLELAAQYIGTYHRLGRWDTEAAEWASGIEEDEGEELDEDWLFPTQENGSSFHFGKELPCVDGYEAVGLFGPKDNTFGMGAFGFVPQEARRNTPWWLRSPTAPLLLRWDGGGAAAFARTLQNMLDMRAFVIILWWERPSQLDGCECDCMEPQRGFGVQDLAFELETEVLCVGCPGPESRYKRQVLSQLARERGSRLAQSQTAGAVLHLVENCRGNVDNSTLSKAVSNALLRRRSSGPLTQKDFAYLSLFAKDKERNASGQGQTLVGQKEVERQLRQVLDALAFQKKRRELGLPADPIHCTFAFLGAPGTGKTTWALRLGEELARMGLLENQDSICINAAELKAKYVGHTTGRVKAIFDQYGIIILDEAYSLTQEQDSDCFTQEALAQLCVELENHACDRLVVFAGYGGDGDPREDRMLRFLQCNPGISSRVAFKIHFDSFQPGELAEVFRAMLTDKGYIVPPESGAVVEELFRRLQGRPDFGNCREARNLADRVKVHMSARLAKGTITAKQASQVLPEDIAAAASELMEEDRTLRRNARAIGF